MGNEIAYLMPTKCKIFLGKERCPWQPPPGGQLPGPLPTPRSQTVLPTIRNWMMPSMWISVRKWGGAGGPCPNPIFDDSRGKWATWRIQNWWKHWWKWCIKIENSLQNYVNFTLGNRFSWAFKTLKPISFRGLRPLDPRCHDGISDEKSTNQQFSAKLYVNSAPPPILPSKVGFLGFKNANLKPMSFRELNPWTPSTRGVESWHWPPVKMVHTENSFQNNMWIFPPVLPSKTGFLRLLNC